MEDSKRKKFSTIFVNDEKIETTYHIINSENPNKYIRRTVTRNKISGIQEIKIEEGTIEVEETRSYVAIPNKSDTEETRPKSENSQPINYYSSTRTIQEDSQTTIQNKLTAQEKIFGNSIPFNKETINQKLSTYTLLESIEKQISVVSSDLNSQTRDAVHSKIASAQEMIE